MTSDGCKTPILEEVVGIKAKPIPVGAEDAVGMKPDKPMSLDDALRIIRDVAEHNTREIPSPEKIAEAMGRSITQVVSAQEALEKMLEEIAKATGLMDQMQIVLSKLWELTKHAYDDRESAR